jgi:hypothetical protein
MKTYIDQYKQFSKLKKFVVIIALLQLFCISIYLMTINSNIIDSILTTIYVYALFIIMPYYNITCLNQTVFYLTEEDYHAMVIK